MTAVGSLVVPAGTLNQTFSVAVTGETLVEADETFFADLAGAVGAILPTGAGSERS